MKMEPEFLENKRTKNHTVTKSALFSDLDSVLTEDKIRALAETARADLDLDDEALAQHAVIELRHMQVHGIRAGVYLLELKRRVGHGNFLAALRELGVDERTARNMMAAAAYVATLPPDQQRRAAALPHTRVLAIRHVDPEVVSELFAEGRLDGEAPLSVRELRKQIERLEKRAKQAEHAAELARLEKLAVEREHDGVELPPWVVAARAEAVIQGEALAAALDILDETVTKKLIEAPPASDRAERARHQQAAAGTLYHTVAAAGAKAAALARKLIEHFGDEIALGLAPAHILFPGEADRLEERRLEVFQSARTQFARRELERANTNPDGTRRRGRPRTRV